MANLSELRNIPWKELCCPSCPKSLECESSSPNRGVIVVRCAMCGFLAIAVTAETGMPHLLGVVPCPEGANSVLDRELERLFREGLQDPPGAPSIFSGMLPCYRCRRLLPTVGVLNVAV